MSAKKPLTTVFTDKKPKGFGVVPVPTLAQAEADISQAFQDIRAKGDETQRQIETATDKLRKGAVKNTI